MNNITNKDFSDFIYEKLEILNVDITLSIPKSKSKFPLIELHTPIKNLLNSYDTDCIISNFQMQITSWSDKIRNSLELDEDIEQILKKYAILKTTQTQVIYDEILNKYGFTSTYEVKHNSINNTFYCIR